MNPELTAWSSESPDSYLQLLAFVPKGIDGDAMRHHRDATVCAPSVSLALIVSQTTVSMADNICCKS